MSRILRKRAEAYAESVPGVRNTEQLADAWLAGYEAHHRMVTQTFRRVAGKFYTETEIALIKKGKIREANRSRRSRLQRSRGNIR